MFKFFCKPQQSKIVSENQRYNSEFSGSFFHQKPGVLNLRKFFQETQIFLMKVQNDGNQMAIDVYQNMHWEHSCMSCLSDEILDEKVKIMKNWIFMPLIFAYYRRLFKIATVAQTRGYEESYARLLNVSRLSISHLELSRSGFKW